MLDSSSSGLDFDSIHRLEKVPLSMSMLDASAWTQKD